VTFFIHVQSIIKANRANLQQLLFMWLSIMRLCEIVTLIYE